jgi:hypothetical protein
MMLKSLNDAENRLNKKICVRNQKKLDLERTKIDDTAKEVDNSIIIYQHIPKSIDSEMELKHTQRRIARKSTDAR